METSLTNGVKMVKIYDGWHRADEQNPRIFHFSVCKFAPGMTRDELHREIDSAEGYFQACRESGQGINSKERIRYLDCIQALADQGTIRYLEET